jgi:hypothetical protein
MAAWTAFGKTLKPVGEKAAREAVGDAEALSRLELRLPRPSWARLAGSMAQVALIPG